MLKKMLPIAVLSASLVSGVAQADALTQIIQQDLAALGYDPGNTDGEASVATAIAISKFESEHNLEVTGEATPQLAGIIKAEIKQGNQPAAAAASSAQLSAQPATQSTAAPADDPIDLQTAQQTCLQEKMAAAKESQQRKRGFARLARAVTRTASQFGVGGISNDVVDLASDVYAADAIAGDFKGAAEDLGLTETDIEECRNPA